jgi:hypothetical protein
MRKYCDREKIYLEILTDIHLFSTLEYEKLFFKFVCMDVSSLAPEVFGGFNSYSAFNGLSIIGRFPVNVNILA